MKKPFYKVLYIQVLFAIVLGVLLGVFYPELGAKMKPLGDGFIKLIKMIIAPVIFCTVVAGIAGMQDMKKIGRVGGKALLYFEVVSTFALAIGLVVANWVKPGAGFITLAATLAVVPTIPVAGMALILGIDRFMSEARAMTNFIGNGVATVVVSKWEKELDTQRMDDVLHGRVPVEGEKDLEPVRAAA